MRLALTPIIVGILIAGASSARDLDHSEYREFVTRLKSTVFVPRQSGVGRNEFCSNVKSLNTSLIRIRDKSEAFIVCDEKLQSIEKNYCSHRCVPPTHTLTREVWSAPDVCTEFQALESWKACLLSYERIVAVLPVPKGDRAVGTEKSR